MEPEIKALSTRRRHYFFLVLLAIFLVSLPLFIFYTSGYRLDFSQPETTIVTTGGMYVTTENLDVEVFLDNEAIKRPRLFRSAYYIQNIETGLHKVVVQREGLHTWVKQLPVDANIVTEAAAFAMPIVPQIRPVSRLITDDGTSIYVLKSTSTVLFKKASTTTPVRIVTRLGTTTTTSNKEYDYIASLFATTSIAELLLEKNDKNKKSASIASSSTSTKVVMPQVIQGHMELVPKNGELYAVWTGVQSNIPYYFCLPLAASTTVGERYGTHVASQFEEAAVATSTYSFFTESNRQCRTAIKIDRTRQAIKNFAFIPNSDDLILLQLSDGLYVTEVDDRSWQNTQLIYPGDNFKMRVTDRAIFITENNTFFELQTVLNSN
jgi:hypothetical protein